MPPTAKLLALVWLPLHLSLVKVSSAGALDSGAGSELDSEGVLVSVASGELLSSEPQAARDRASTAVPAMTLAQVTGLVRLTGWDLSLGCTVSAATGPSPRSQGWVSEVTVNRQCCRTAHRTLSLANRYVNDRHGAPKGRTSVHLEGLEEAHRRAALPGQAPLRPLWSAESGVHGGGRLPFALGLEAKHEPVAGVPQRGVARRRPAPRGTLGRRAPSRRRERPPRRHAARRRDSARRRARAGRGGRVRRRARRRRPPAPDHHHAPQPGPVCAGHVAARCSRSTAVTASAGR